MKKIISLMLTLTLLLTTMTFASASELELSDVMQTKVATQSVFNYPLTPSSAEWKNYSALELKEMLNIPQEVIEKMDTETLLATVLEYPFMADIYAFDTTEQGIEALSMEFNGAAELLKRPDLADKLQAVQKRTTAKMITVNSRKEVSQNEIMKKMYTESLLVYPQISSTLSQDEKNIVIQRSEQVSEKLETASIVKASTTSPGTVLSTGTVSTPRGSSVAVMSLQEWTDADIKAINKQYDELYTKATRLRSASYKYNCHSYAWYNTSSSNTWWMNDPTSYMTDGSYVKLITDPQAGDKIYWTNTHSGIVTAVSGSNVTVTSKWGAAGLYSHPQNECPYSIVIIKTFWRKK